MNLKNLNDTITEKPLPEVPSTSMSHHSYQNHRQMKPYQNNNSFQDESYESFEKKPQKSAHHFQMQQYQQSPQIIAPANDAIVQRLDSLCQVIEILQQDIHQVKNNIKQISSLQAQESLQFKNEEIRKLQIQTEDQEKTISQLSAERTILLDIIKKLGSKSLENLRYIKSQFEEDAD